MPSSVKQALAKWLAVRSALSIDINVCLFLVTKRAWQHDIHSLQQILGYESIATTEIYTYVDNSQLQAGFNSNPESHDAQLNIMALWTFNDNREGIKGSVCTVIQLK